MTHAHVHRLTPAERETLRLMACGMTNKEIRDARGTALPTVVCHINAIYDKLCVHSRTQATLYALRHGIVTLDEACEAAGIGEGEG